MVSSARKGVAFALPDCQLIYAPTREPAAPLHTYEKLSRPSWGPATKESTNKIDFARQQLIAARLWADKCVAPAQFALIYEAALRADLIETNKKTAGRLCWLAGERARRRWDLIKFGHFFLRRHFWRHDSLPGRRCVKDDCRAAIISWRARTPREPREVGSRRYLLTWLSFALGP